MPMTLKEARRKKKLTQAELAALTGLRQAHISDLERGAIERPRWDTVRRLCQVLGVRPEVIFPLSSEVA